VDALAGAVAFFDIGNTLASVVVAPSGDRIERLTVFPDVPAVLGALISRGVRLGIISDRGTIPAEQVNQALEAAGILDFFEPALIIYGKKDSPEVFEFAATQAGAPDPARRLLFVGEDPAERAQALRANFLVAPHPGLALPALQQ
jgi:bacterial leucyl aminopeptidase